MNDRLTSQQHRQWADAADDAADSLLEQPDGTAEVEGRRAGAVAFLQAASRAHRDAAEGRL